MIAFIKGIVDSVGENYIVLETGGVGYQIFVASTSVGKARLSEEMKIYTYMNVREDALNLYGFLSKEELDMFNMLISVTGVGPKAALGILGVMTPREISLAILTEDYTNLSRAPGIGKKTAQLLVLKLKDKLQPNEQAESYTGSQQNLAASDEKRDAIDALVTLGYSRSDALKAVLEVAVVDMGADQIIKSALRKLSSL